MTGKGAGGREEQGEHPALAASADVTAAGESPAPSYTPRGAPQPETIPGDAVIMVIDPAEIQVGDFIRMAAQTGALLGWRRVTHVEHLYGGAGPTRLTFHREGYPDGSIILEQRTAATDGGVMLEVSGLQIARPVVTVTARPRRWWRWWRR